MSLHKANRQPPAMAVHKVPVTIKAAPFASGWQTAIQRPPRIELKTLDFARSAPGILSIAMAGARPKVRSFWFAPPKLPVVSRKAQPHRPRPQRKSQTTTRIAPPGDIVKLEDRLYYALQPPLETLLTSGALQLPFHPFPYQFSGIAFLYPRYSAVLADEMGLGKTMQAITSVRLLLHAGHVRRVLLVLSQTVGNQLATRIRVMGAEIPLNVVQGNQARRTFQWQQPDAIVTVANYEIVNRDRELAASPDLGYDLVILDESQRIKNRNGATSQAIRAISPAASWALTGTPVENSADDLVGIFEFVCPGLLSPGMKPRRIAAAVRDHVIRRTKDQVLDDLPPKMMRDAELHLSPEQKETYRRCEDEGVVNLSNMGESVTVHHVFELVLRLKQICNFDPATGASAKLDRLEADLEEVAASGRKAIVFSQWVQTLQTLAERLSRFGPLEYHGKIPSGRRDAVIDRFRNDPDCHVILMSYGAGGVGLNLQFSEYVFLFDRWWNPAIEDQAINRAHRIGAAGPVTVTRFLTVNSIEERINRILEEKREIFATIFDSSQVNPSSMGLTQNEIFGLFDLHSPDGPIDAAA